MRFHSTATPALPTQLRTKSARLGSAQPLLSAGNGAVAGESAQRTSVPIRVASVLGRLSPNEWRRRLWHFAPGVIVLMLAPFPHEEPLSPFITGVVLIFAILIPVAALCNHTTFRRAQETNCLAAVFGYAATIVPLLLLFRSQPELGLTVMGVIAFGDGSATLVGLLARGSHLPWNGAKTWMGTSAFVLIGVPAATMIYWLESMPRVSFETALLCVIPTVAVSASMESLPVKFNDNILVGLGAAATLLAMHAVCVGF